jgi:hypothetical protein
MRNHDRFVDAFAHGRHKVMGRWLEPFTLRHRFWLDTFGSPLVTGGKATAVDLEMAARVCAIPFRHLDARVPVMLSSGPGLLGKAAFAWKVIRCKTEVEYSAFQAYLADHGCPPVTHDGGAQATEEGKRYETMPGLLGLITAVIRGSGWPPETVWALSPGAAEWYLTGIFMHRGVDMHLKTEHDEEFEEAMRKEKEEKEKSSVNGS